MCGCLAVSLENGTPFFQEIKLVSKDVVFLVTGLAKNIIFSMKSILLNLFRRC